MEKFFGGGNDGGESAVQFHLIVFHKIVRTQTDPAFHRFQFAGIRFAVTMLEQAAFVETLYDRWRRVEGGKRIVDPFFPFGGGEIGPERNSTPAPAERRESAHFQKEIAIFLAELRCFPPIVNFQTRNNCVLRQRGRIEYP